MHLCYSKEKLGDDSSYSAGKAELRDLEIIKSWYLVLEEKVKYYQFYNQMAPMRIINGAWVTTVFIRRFPSFPLHFPSRRILTQALQG